MAAHIQTDYDRLVQIANYFTQEANNIQQWVGMADGSVEQLRASWKGDAATKFFGDWEVLSPKLNKLVQALNTASEQVNAVSSIFSEAENNAQSRLRSRGR